MGSGLQIILTDTVVIILELLELDQIWLVRRLYIG